MQGPTLSGLTGGGGVQSGMGFMGGPEAGGLMTPEAWAPMSPQQTPMNQMAGNAQGFTADQMTPGFQDAMGVQGMNPQMQNAQDLASDLDMQSKLEMGQQAMQMVGGFGQDARDIQFPGSPWGGQFQSGVNPGLGQMMASIQGSGQGGWGY